MKSSFIKKALSAIDLQLVLVVGIVIMVNVFVSPIHARWDMTQDKVYTLSDPSRQSVAGLSSPVTIKLYFSEEVPQNMLAVIQDVTDLVSEYDSEGGDMVIVDQLDPDTSEIARREVESYGIPEVQFNVIEDDRFEVSSGYAGIVIIYQDSQEVIPVVGQTQSLEYDLTTRIEKLTAESLPEVLFVKGNGTQPTDVLESLLSSRYQVRSISPAELIDEAGIAFIVGPTEPYTEAELYAIDQFVLRGGQLIVLEDGQRVNEATLEYAPNETNLNNLLSNYGVSISEDIVADYDSAQIIPIETETGQVTAPYAFWPLATTTLDSSHPITRDIPSVVFPWPSSLQFEIEEDTSGNRLRALTTRELVTTSPRSYGFTDDLTGLSPEDIFEPAGLKQLRLAVLLEGELFSQFGSEAPAGFPQEAHIAETDSGSLLIVGNARFINDQLIANNPENATLLLNAVDVLTQDDALIGIRSRSALDRPLEPIGESKKRLLRFGNLFFSAVAVILLAVFIHRRRRRASRTAKQLYA